MNERVATAFGQEAALLEETFSSKYVDDNNGG
jgi:hypothetical protein